MPSQIFFNGKMIKFLNIFLIISKIRQHLDNALFVPLKAIRNKGNISFVIVRKYKIPPIAQPKNI